MVQAFGGTSGGIAGVLLSPVYISVRPICPVSKRPHREKVIYATEKRSPELETACYVPCPRN